MIPLAVPNLAGNERRYLQECIDTTFVSSVGPFVGRFEGMVAAASGTTAAVAVASGTAALHVSLAALGVGPGDLVILPALTFIASANAIAYCGASPWLVDVDPESWTLDPARLRAALREWVVAGPDGPRHRISGRPVRAILPVYTLGVPADMDPIVAMAAEYGLPVVVDAACALGATYRGRALGDLGADLSAFSFNGNKTVTAGGGGAITGAAGERLDLCRHLSTTARRGAEYDHDRVGFNYRMTNLQAAVGCAQMELLDSFVAAKRRIRARYNSAFADIKGASLFPSPAWADSACWFSGLVLPPEHVEDAGPLRDRLRARGVDARPFWKPVHLQAPYAEAPYEPLPVTEAIWRRILTLPCSTHLSTADQDAVITAVLEELS